MLKWAGLILVGVYGNGLELYCCSYIDAEKELSLSLLPVSDYGCGSELYYIICIAASVKEIE